MLYKIEIETACELCGMPARVLCFWFVPKCEAQTFFKNRKDSGEEADLIGEFLRHGIFAGKYMSYARHKCSEDPASRKTCSMSLKAPRNGAVRALMEKAIESAHLPAEKPFDKARGKSEKKKKEKPKRQRIRGPHQRFWIRPLPETRINDFLMMAVREMSRFLEKVRSY